MWNVIDDSFVRNGRRYWHCICDCGTEKLVSDSDLKSGRSRQCRKCASAQPYSKIGQEFSYVQKEVLSKVRAAAQNAIERCTNTEHKRYADWGGRGIKVQFENKDEFVRHLLSLPGYDDLSLVIDRIDNEGHYEVGNLRWLNRSDSQRNQRDEGGQHGYFMKHRFARSFKRLHDNGHSFKTIAELYCADAPTVRNCVRELETGNAFGS